MELDYLLTISDNWQVLHLYTELM